MSGYNSFQNLYDVKKTVRFGLKSIKYEIKNKSYQEISDKFKDNNQVKTQIEKYINRINESSDVEKWAESKNNLQETVTNLEKLIGSIKDSLYKLDNLKDDSKQNLKISFKLAVIKNSCGFGKNLLFNKEINKLYKNKQIYYSKINKPRFIL